ncbi:hypothetical protein GUJ93_ZPchr0006g43325 [Zizania palustris]|uniref:Uncharacterized protein n=1 Tax=Zizania palustris TaxID=103762 RepID=A0A8J5W1Z3_ZIZPA|nr:hypothetical protein GUJ93_ZPchr0006g43325 [Zizania palustris]
MEVAATAAAAAATMDFHALSRRVLQALCKRNGVRANMTNAAMADALQSLPSVEGIDEIDTMLCLPTPGRSAMKLALKSAAAVGEEEQQHGSLLPRSRRVSVKSPEAIRMDIEDGEDEMKRDLVKEIVRTPGVALRSTSCAARATPALIPTPAASSTRTTTRRTVARKTEEATLTPATLRRSQRTVTRKAPALMEVEVMTTKRTTRSARSKVMIDLDQEEEEMAAAPQEDNVHKVEPKGVASDEKCDVPDPDEEETMKLLEEGNGKEEESEQSEEVVSSAAPIGIAVISDKSCDDLKEEVVATEVEVAETVVGVMVQHQFVGVENSAPLPTMEDSPILGVLSKREDVEPVKEITDENYASDDNEVPEENVPATMASDEASVEDGLNEVKEVSADVMPQADLTIDEISKEEDLDEVKERAAPEMPQAELTEDDISDESGEEVDLDDESSEEDILDEESADEATKEETDGESDTSEVATDESGEEVDFDDESCEVDILDEESADQATKEAGESDTSDVATDSDGLTDIDDEEDDLTGDLLPEFESAGKFSDAETESETTTVISSDPKTSAVNGSRDDSFITDELEASSEEVSRNEIESSLNPIVKSLDEFTNTVEGNKHDALTEEKMSIDAETVGANGKKKTLTVEDLNGKSLRKLKSMYKEGLIANAAAEGKRLALVEVDNNASINC